MKNLIIGMILGIALSGVAAYLGSGKLKQESYDNGFNAGMTAGKAEGIKQGTAQGMEQGMNEEKTRQAAVKDSLATALKDNEAALAKARAPKRAKEPAPIQNWHVRGGVIEEPIHDTESSPTP